MTSHDKLFEIVQKVFNAGQKFKVDSDQAYIDDEPLPAAYPVITPLIDELVKYVDGQIEAEREECAMIAQTLMPRDMETWYKEDAGLLGYNISCTDIMTAIRKRALPSQSKPGRPSSPFRSVEIVDGGIVK